MAQPNPIWGLHLTPGALTGALVARVGDAFRVTETFEEEAPRDAAALREHALVVLARPGVRGRAVLVATPDDAITVTTGWIPPDQLHLTDDELYAELHEFVPFELGQGHLVYRSTGPRDARRYLLAGLDAHGHDAIRAWAEALDGRFHGIGLATPALLRGIDALGLDSPGGVVVQPAGEVTMVLAAASDGPRRHLLPLDARAVTTDDAAAARLARDILRAADYEHARARRRMDDPEAPHAPEGDVVIVGHDAQRVRDALAPHLGARLAAADARRHDSIVGDVDGEQLTDDVAATYAGAIGAALEAFAEADDRLVLRHPPRDVPEYRAAPGQGGGHRAPIAVVCAVAVAGVLAAVFWPRDAETPSRGNAAATRGNTAAPRVGTTAVAERVPDKTATTTFPRIAAVVAQNGGARVEFATPPAAAGLLLERRFLPDGAWEPVVVGGVPAGARAFQDPLPGGGGAYEWRIRGAEYEPLRADIEVPITAELLGGEDGLAHIRLSRDYAGETMSAETDVRPGDPLTAVAVWGSMPGIAQAEVHFPTHLHVTSVEVRAHPVAHTTQVPRFRSDGTLERDAAGTVVNDERIDETTEDVLHVEAQDPEGTVHTWVRKMTDG